VADASPPPGRWAFRPVPPEPRSVVELIRGGTLDAQLAATIWLLIEGGVPILVAGEGRGTGRTTLLGALLDFVPPETRVVELAGASETFDWLPQASELGWPAASRPAPDRAVIKPDTALLLASELSDHLPAYTWGDAARLAVRAASIGYGLAATIDADALDEVFDALRRPPVRLSDDELSHLGVVLVLRRVEASRRRVVVAHYVRPVSRDVHGHVQRLGPAVLATWDPATDRLEHFGWGVIPELAMRTGRRAGDFELELDARRTVLDRLAATGRGDVDAVRAKIADYRATATSATSTGRPSPAHHPAASTPN
jgi:flagellar protein FlaI